MPEMPEMPETGATGASAQSEYRGATALAPVAPALFVGQSRGHSPILAL